MESRSVNVVWHCAALESTEHSAIEESENGWKISGIVVAPIGSTPGHIEYSVTTNLRWETQRASIEIHGPLATRIEVQLAAGSWSLDGVAHPELGGCVDIDLGFTPATNTLPIRRLNLAVGQAATTTAAWFKFPEMAFVSAIQRYERIGASTWRYTAGQSDFVLDVDEYGRVLSYGDGLWLAVARTQ